MAVPLNPDRMCMFPAAEALSVDPSIQGCEGTPLTSVDACSPMAWLLPRALGVLMLMLFIVLAEMSLVAAGELPGWIGP